DAFYRTPETGLKVPGKPVTPTPAAATPTATTTAVQSESTPAPPATVIHG
ncbi:unnamed protein product, partial [Ectocarpus fasciculatus]